MEKKWKIAGLFAVLLVAIGAISTSFAYMGDAGVRNYTEERHEAMEAAFESGNYTAWRALMSGVVGRNGGSPRILSAVTAENFGEFAQAHESGDMTAFRSKYGLGQGRANGSGKGVGRGAGRSNCPYQTE